LQTIAVDVSSLCLFPRTTLHAGNYLQHIPNYGKLNSTRK
jgi:hypothetical protein